MIGFPRFFIVAFVSWHFLLCFDHSRRRSMFGVMKAQGFPTFYWQVSGVTNHYYNWNASCNWTSLNSNFGILPRWFVPFAINRYSMRNYSSFFLFSILVVYFRQSGLKMTASSDWLGGLFMSKSIEMINITKDFIQGDDVIHALKETNFTAEEGELIAIIGPSGSGKSTFLTILGGLQTPTTGQVLIDGKPFSKLNIKERSKVRFDKIGFILQAANLIPFLTINDQMYLHNRIQRNKPNHERLEELYTKLDIKKLQKKYPNELSGGETTGGHR